jgi:hypothetical protein
VRKETADPSTSLGMTNFRFVSEVYDLCLGQNDSFARHSPLNFVIPEWSMGLRAAQGDENRFCSQPLFMEASPSPLSSRPERTRISCCAAVDRAACAAFRKESRMKFANATKPNRKSGGA